KLLPKAYSTAQVMSVDIFESRIEGQARFHPISIAEESKRPARNSSLTRSKMSTLASTAIPIERTKPAIPASDKTTPASLKTANVKAAYKMSAKSASRPGKR